MGKIQKTAAYRHEASLSPALSEFIKATAQIPLYQLQAHLASFPRLWSFPRGDLYHWIPVLNRFDRILEEFNEGYGLTKGLQTEPFGRRLLLKDDPGKETATQSILDKLGCSTDGDRVLVERVIEFSRLLLENCGNRSLYASSGHLGNLLNTTSLSLLDATLRLTLRLAQRYHSSKQRGMTSTSSQLLAAHYNINLEKILKLAAPFVKSPATETTSPFIPVSSKGKEKVSSGLSRKQAGTKLHPADLVSMVKEEGIEDTAWEEWGGVVLSYYENAASNSTTSPSHHEMQPTDVSSVSTPTAARRSSNLWSQSNPRPPRLSQTDESPTSVTPTTTRAEEPSQNVGPKTLEIPYSKASTKPAHELLASTMNEVPEESRYDLLHRIRVAQALSGNQASREQIVAVRILAIANLAYVHPESIFQQKLSQQDSDEPRRFQLAHQLAELVHPPGDGASGVSRELQTLALWTLEALTKQKSKAMDVYTALSVSVNHGVLFYVVRTAVAQLRVEDGDTVDLGEEAWREAMFSLLLSLPTSVARAGDHLVSAGLLEILVEALTVRTAKAERSYHKVLTFLDSFVANVREAFQSLVNAKGLDLLADLASFEVETALAKVEKGEVMPEPYKTQLTDYRIAFYHQQTLKMVFKFMNHMMQHTTGNFDRLLRNLIDSPQLLTALRKVLANDKIYGSNVWSAAVNILSSFIHNEPTSYAVIAEAGLSKGLLEAVTQHPISEPDQQSANEASSTSSGDSTEVAVEIEQSAFLESLNSLESSDRRLAGGILPVAEAISAVTQAFDAICLNENGLKLFKGSGALESFFEIFESADHIKALDGEMDTPTALGNHFDELVRHHPLLKKAILRSVLTMVARVGALCFRRAKNKGVGAKLWVAGKDGTLYVAGGRGALVGKEGSLHEKAGLERLAKKDESGDVEMIGGEIASQSGDRVDEPISIDDVTENEDLKVEPAIPQYISVACRFLNGFFSNTTHTLCASFIEGGGLEWALDLATLPCLPYNFDGGGAVQQHDDLGRLIQIIVEQKPHLALPSIIKRLQSAIDDLEPFLDHQDESQYFAPFTNRSSTDGKAQAAQASMLQDGTRYVKAMVNINTLTNALAQTFQSAVFTHRSTSNVFTQANLADMYVRLVDSLGRLHRRCIWEEIMLQRNMPDEWDLSTRISSFDGLGTHEADEALGIMHSDIPDSSGRSGSSNSPVDKPQNGEPKDPQSITEKERSTFQFKNTRILRYLLSQVPLAIPLFFHSLGKTLLLRRVMDSYQKQNAYKVADQLALSSLDMLRYDVARNSSSVKDRYNYWIVILSSVSKVMIDDSYERPFQTLTLVLQSFKNQGGLTVLNDILETFYDEAKAIAATHGDEEPRSEAGGLMSLALGGLKLIFSFYSLVINAKHVTDATQTQAMSGRQNSDRDRPDYFSAAQFLVELRMAVIHPVQKMWNSDLMDKATTSIIKTIVEILRLVLEGESEKGAWQRVDKVPQRGKVPDKAWTVRSPESLERLSEHFGKDLAREALYRCYDNLSVAREYCTAQKDDPRATRNPIPTGESQPSAQPRSSTSATQVSTESSSSADVSADRPLSGSVMMEDAPDFSQEIGDAAWRSTLPSLSGQNDPLAALLLGQDIGDFQGILNGAGSDFPNPDLSSSNQAAGSSAVDNAIEAAKIPELVTIDDLNEERSGLRKDLIDRSLDVLNVHDDVTFELSELIYAAVPKTNDGGSLRGEVGSTLVQSLISLQMDDDFRPQGKKISAYAHLLALILQDREFYNATLEELKDGFSTLVGFIKVFPDQKAEEPPVWIGQVLLIVERLLSEDAQPHQIQWNPPSATDEISKAGPVAELPTPLVPQEEKGELFEALLAVLPRIGKDESLALSIVRTLAILTRNRDLAIRLGEKQNMLRLFTMIRQLAGMNNEKLQGAFMLILRHVVEDEDTLRQIMRTEIQQAFEGRNQRQADTTSYTRQMSHLVLRSPELFVEVTNEKLMLTRYDAAQRPQLLTLKKEKEELVEPKADDTSLDNVVSEPLNDTEGPSTSEQKQLDTAKPSELKHPVVENPDGVIQYLLSELLAYKNVEDPEQHAATQKTLEDTHDADIDMLNGDPSASSAELGPVLVDAEQKKSDKPEFKAEQHPIYVYRCFILQCLTELLASYNRTKVEFINFSRKPEPQVATPSKPRSGVLNYLLNCLIPVGTLSHAEDITSRKKVATSNWAIYVIVSLCSKTGERGFNRASDTIEPEDEPELLYVRKFVLEHALRAFKDAHASTESLDLKYSRLLNLADLFNRMLVGKPNSPTTSTSNVSSFLSSQRQLGKTMYEKNFIHVLTTSITDIDVNFPGAKRAVKYILRPLRMLSGIAIDMSLHSDSSTTPGSADEDEISSATSVSELGDDREETPDLFRNSALGMLEPGREEGSESEEEEDDNDEEMYDDEFGEEMEYEEEMSPDHDEVVSDDEEIEGMGPIEGLPGNVGMDLEVVVGEDEDDDLTEDDDDDSEDMDEDDDPEDDDDDDDGEDMDDIMDEIDDHDGLPGADDEDWGTDEEDGEDYDGQDDVEIDMGDLPQHGHGSLNDIVRVLEGQNPTDLLQRLEDGDLDMDLGPEGYMDDDMQEDDDEEEEEEEDYDEDDIVYEAGRYDDDDMHDMAFGWDAAGLRGHRHLNHRNPWSFVAHGNDRILVPAYHRSHRTGATPRTTDDGINPLLQRSGRSGSLSGPPGRRGEHMSDWVHAIDPIRPGFNGGRGQHGGPVSLISNLLNMITRGGRHTDLPPGAAFHLTVGGLPMGAVGHVDAPLYGGSLDSVRLPRPRAEQSRSSRDDPSQAVSFTPQLTIPRWQDEARLLFGSASIEKSSRVVPSVLRLLVPPAIEAQKQREKEEAERAQKRREELETQKAKEAAEKVEREAKERKDKEERDAAEAEAAAQRAREKAGEEEGHASNASPEVQSMEGVENSEAAECAVAAPEPEEAPRIFTTIRGQETDITGMGIDLEYLEALPEDIREEVLVQQVAQQRSEAREAGQNPTEINREFLDALPEDIRAELLAQEAQDRRRREREEARRRTAVNGGPPAPRADDVDPTSFLASLDPHLRQAVLLEQDDDMLAQLPDEIAAEARALGGDRRLNQFMDMPGRMGAGRSRSGVDRHDQNDEQSQKKAKSRPVPPILDKAGVAGLLRLQFVPQQGSARQSLNGILRDACENLQNRAEIISTLLQILQDVSSEVNTVERSFAQLSLRAKQPSVQKTPQPLKRTLSNHVPANSEMSPLMVVQQCLATLVYLTGANPTMSFFFLREHETASAFKPRLARKGKNKETKASKYPLNVLLGLLDRKLVIESSPVMEQLASLLQNITLPLHMLLVKKDKEKPSTNSDNPPAQGEKEEEHNDTSAATTTEIDPTEAQPISASVAQDLATATPIQGDVPKPQEHGDEKLKKARKELVPPEVPEYNLRLVVNIIAARECSSKTFRDTLSLVNNLSAIPEAKEIFGQELATKAQELGQSILTDLGDLIAQILRAKSGTDVQGMALSRFSPASSDQAKLLRVMTALDYLFDPKRAETPDKPAASDMEGLATKQKEDILTSLYENLTFQHLWGKLGDCLSAIRQRGNMFGVANILLPLIEVLMVVCKNTTLKDTPLTKTIQKEFALSSPPPESGMENLFFTFTEEHRKILNDLVRHNPKLMSGSFSLLVKNSKVLEFDNKRNFFNRKLHQRGAEIRHPHQPLQLSVRRDQVFLDSFKALYFKKGDEMKYGKLSIRFHGEEGVDAGGVTREWFQVLSKQMFNADYALFVPVASDRTTFHPNPLSAVNGEHLMFFKFIGRIIGKALYENRVLDCHFSRAVYKRMLGKSVSVKDMESIDLDYHKSLLWMLENDITDIITETFSITSEVFGLIQIIDLIEDGRNVPVTEDNKQEYVRLVVEHKMIGAVKDQVEHFLEGFHDIVPAELISIFNEQELELLISGLPDIDVDDWKNNAEYHNYTAASPQIQWFWRAVRSYDKEERAKLLQFVTGTSKVPLNGFKELEGMNGFSRFNIHRDYGSKDRLPSSHTCFNQLDLPEYDDYETLRKSVYIAMTAGSEYFGFA